MVVGEPMGAVKGATVVTDACRLTVCEVVHNAVL
jgi:hypothetical protein